MGIEIGAALGHVIGLETEVVSQDLEEGGSRTEIVEASDPAALMREMAHAGMTFHQVNHHRGHD